jgi:hypothetical protein
MHVSETIGLQAEEELAWITAARARSAPGASRSRRTGGGAHERMMANGTSLRAGYPQSYLAQCNRAPRGRSRKSVAIPTRPNARNLMSRRTQTVVLVGGWIFAIALFVFMYVTYYGTKLSYSQKFPGMPFYGAMTWWFFFTIPIIGFTWGYFNDLKNRG